MLDIRNVTINAGKFSVSDVSLSIDDGMCHAIVGPTGSGKTLMLESVIGLRRPARGSIHVRGTDVVSVPIEKRGISYVPQDLALFPHLTVEENIKYSIKIKNNRDNGHNEMVMQLVDIVGIKDLLKRSVKNLSGGEKQRIALVRAVAAGNNCLVLDEPFSALHQGLRRELWFVLKELQKKYNLTVLMVSHDMEEAFFLADTISVMIGGKLRQTGSGRDIYESPATRDVVNFLGIRNLFPITIREVTGEGIKADCDSLGGELTLPASFNGRREVREGERRMVGIRPENLVISKPEAPVENGDNLVEGEIKGVFMKGASHTVIFSPKSGNRTIELEIADCSFKKFNPHPGQKLTVLLRAGNFFLLED